MNFKQFESVRGIERANSCTLIISGGLPAPDDEGQNSWTAIFWSLVLVLAGTGHLWHHQTEDTVAALHRQCEMKVIL